MMKKPNKRHYHVRLLKRSTSKLLIAMVKLLSVNGLAEYHLHSNQSVDVMPGHHLDMKCLHESSILSI